MCKIIEYLSICGSVQWDEVFDNLCGDNGGMCAVKGLKSCTTHRPISTVKNWSTKKTVSIQSSTFFGNAKCTQCTQQNIHTQAFVTQRPETTCMY